MNCSKCNQRIVNPDIVDLAIDDKSLFSRWKYKSDKTILCFKCYKTIEMVEL